MKVLVAIPCYNCSAQIPRVLAGFDDALLDRVWRVMVIDNGSTDGTVDAALAAAHDPRIEVFRNDDNYNLGGTHKVAFLRAEAEGCTHTAILHGDNQAKTSELHDLLDEAQRTPKVAAVLGARFMPGAEITGYSRRRTWGNLGLNALYTAISLRDTRDLGSGLNLMRMRDLLDRRYLDFTDTLNFNHDLLLDYYTKRCLVRFVPISWSETDQVSNAKSLELGWGALEKLLRWRIAREKRFPSEAERYTSTRVSA